MFRLAVCKPLHDALHDRNILLVDHAQFHDRLADSFLRAPAEHLFSCTCPSRYNEVTVPFNNSHWRVVRMKT